MMYELDINGDKVQNVGLRKKMHSLLDKEKIPGIAINDPYGDKVRAYVGGKKFSRDKVKSQLADYIKNKTGKDIFITERKPTDRLKKIKITQQQLKDVSNGQYLAYMMASGERRNNRSNGLGLKKAENDLLPRFRLKATNDKNYHGIGNKMMEGQLTGKTPHYKKFMRQNHKVSKMEALKNMSKKDREKVEDSLSRTGEDFLGN